MDALLQQATPAQRQLMAYLAGKEGDARYLVPAPEWVKLIMTATAGVKEDDLAYLITLEWNPGEVTADQLRANIQQALQRKKAGDAPGLPPEEGAPVAPEQKSAGKTTAQIKQPSKPVATTGTAGTEGKKPKEPAESPQDRVARLFKRAQSYGKWDRIGHGAVSYPPSAKLGETVTVELYLTHTDPKSGKLLRLTADASGQFSMGNKGEVFTVHSCTEFVTPDGEVYPTGGAMVGESFSLKGGP